jgi:sirohydrochlorin cobaltochelatase
MAEKIGVLVIAHGSRSSRWVRLVDDAVKQVKTEHPLTVGFLELVEGRKIQDGIDALEAQGVNRIFAIPLFASSGSKHIEEIRFMLGLTGRLPAASDVAPLNVHAKVAMSPAMDDHPYIAEMLAKRIQALIRKPEEEAVLLVGHGNELPGFKEKWEAGMNGLVKQLRRKFPLACITSASLSSDELQKRADALSQKYRVLVLPLFLSEGYFTDQLIPSRLEGLKVEYLRSAYLPDPGVSRWMEAMVEDLKKKTKS